MKKLFFCLVCILIEEITLAQVQHMKFKGIPIDGTLKEYISAMTKVGFKYDDTYEGVAILTGDFAGFKNCTIGVSTLQNCDLVNCIAVLFPSNNKWPSLLDDYEQLKEMLITKYEEPEFCEEYFKKEVNDDDSKKYAVGSDDCVWKTVFETELGEIELSIVDGVLFHSGTVRIVYYDKINTQKVKKAAMDDL